MINKGSIGLDKSFKPVMWFKAFMVICIWGLLPLLIPAEFIPLFGLHLPDAQVILLRVWGVIVLLDFFVYWYIYKNPAKKLTKYLLWFAVIDNSGLGIALLILTPILSLPWGIWINIPFQLFFGYWFLKYVREGEFKN